jgi:hypothetical protein
MGMLLIVCVGVTTWAENDVEALPLPCHLHFSGKGLFGKGVLALYQGPTLVGP